MGVVYFSIPLISGYYVMEWAKSKSVQNLGANGEKLLRMKGGVSRDQATIDQNRVLQEVLTRHSSTASK